MIQEAINYPRNSDSAIKTVAIGGLLLLLGFLVVPVVLVLGYVVRTLRAVLDGVEEPPEFDDWGDLGTDGLKAFAITLAYSLIPASIALVAILAGGVTLGLTGPGQGGNVAMALIAVGAAVVVTLLSVLGAYLLPAAIVAWVRTDRLGAAFSPAELRTYAFSQTYATGWLVAVAISLLAGILIGVLNAVVIGAVLAPFVTFYAYVAGTQAIGSAVRSMPAVDDATEQTIGKPVA